MYEPICGSYLCIFPSVCGLISGANYSPLVIKNVEELYGRFCLVHLRKFEAILNGHCGVLLQGITPLTLNVTKPDPIFNDAFMPLTASKEMPVRAALSNSFGFGGTNASLLFSSPS